VAECALAKQASPRHDKAVFLRVSYRQVQLLQHRMDKGKALAHEELSGQLFYKHYRAEVLC